jgi:hypothetical protein
MTPSASASNPWHNSRTLVGLLFLTSLVLWIAAAAIALAAIGICMPFHFSALFQAAFYVVIAFSVGGGARWTWRAARILGKNEVRFAPDGMHIRLYSAARRFSEFSLPWTDVASVKRAPGVVTISGVDGRAVSLSGYEFFRPLALGREIARQAGREVTESSEPQAVAAVPGH